MSALHLSDGSVVRAHTVRALVLASTEPRVSPRDHRGALATLAADVIVARFDAASARGESVYLPRSGSLLRVVAVSP